METDAKYVPVPVSRSLKLWLLFALIAVTVLAMLQFGRNPGGGASPAVGEALASFHLQPLSASAEEMDLQDLQGRVSVVNFWGTWCPPCRVEFPHLVKLRRKYQGHHDFQLLPVSCGMGRDSDLPELRAETFAFLHAQGFDLPVYADLQASTRIEVHKLLAGDVFSYPTTLVMDRQAKIRGAWVGYQPGDEREVESLVSELLAASGAVGD